MLEYQSFPDANQNKHDHFIMTLHIVMIFTKVVVISPDSCLVHKTWALAPTEDGGLGGIHFPMMEVMMTTTMMLWQQQRRRWCWQWWWQRWDPQVEFSSSIYQIITLTKSKSKSIIFHRILVWGFDFPAAPSHLHLTRLWLLSEDGEWCQKKAPFHSKFLAHTEAM